MENSLVLFFPRSLWAYHLVIFDFNTLWKNIGRHLIILWHYVFILTKIISLLCQLVIRHWSWMLIWWAVETSCKLTHATSYSFRDFFVFHVNKNWKGHSQRWYNRHPDWKRLAVTSVMWLTTEWTAGEQ